MKEKRPNLVFLISVALTLFICLWGIIQPGSFTAAANGSMNFLTTNFAWLYCFAMSVFVLFCIWIGFFSKYKNVRFGPDDSRPEYSNMAWFSMLFSAGMGVGLVFWGVAEPLNFFIYPIEGITPGSGEAMKFAFSKAFLHWGIHPWANYAVLAMALAFMQFRKGKPALISSVFIPLLGEERVNGWLGKTIDVLALFATAGGVATSLGLGVLQINSGLNFLFKIPETRLIQLILIIALAVVYIATAITGIDKGISFVSDLNVKIALGVMAVLVVVGPTVPILNNMMEGLGAYLNNLVGYSFAVGAFSDQSWYKGWTIFYWAWWIAWAPFTGSFIARISRGRTIGEFVRGVMLLPAGFSVIWFSVFGTLGLHVDLETAKLAVASTSTALFTILKQYPLGVPVSVVIFVLICTFFITSANSATYVLGMYSEEGTLNPSNKSKMIWGILMAALAAVMMMASDDGLNMLQILSIVAAFPFTFIMLAAIPSLMKGLKQEFPSLSSSGAAKPLAKPEA
ncbi:BCCT family transporter [Oscillibacter sp.]|uniref:BCCT family transporter n=1 Tax=Oscillibacter sp. TaxID=1945593 RepID=UPI002898FFA9|nr:BCCT family transporter [Oscillibacter sp.]